jgi:hypothetical protein
MTDAEVYVLCPERSGLAAIEFLDAVMPRRSAAAEDYPFPQFVDAPDVVFTRPEEVIARLQDFPNESYSMYWHNELPDDPYGCMLFYTEDQGLIVGVVVRDSNAVLWLHRLALMTGGKYGYLTSEEAPGSKAEFIERCRVGTVARIYEGELVA